MTLSYVMFVIQILCPSVTFNALTSMDTISTRFFTYLAVQQPLQTLVGNVSHWKVNIFLVKTMKIYSQNEAVCRFAL